tara:strand:- start:74 stop:718 length:645 start_codon:yes stop_codon:yes gene_type:complete
VKSFCLIFLIAYTSAYSQPFLESGKTLDVGDEFVELSILSNTANPKSLSQFSQVQLQRQFGLGKKFEWRFAVAAAQSPHHNDFSLLTGLQFEFYRNSNWSTSIASTTSIMDGNQIIPQNKLWVAVSNFSDQGIETNINFGFCQNTLSDPIQPFAAAGWVVPARNKLIHFETYFQPDGNSAIQIGIDLSKGDYQTLFMIGHGFSGPAFLSVVRAL